jgi:transcriptional regulator with XRE-family HTH domain
MSGADLRRKRAAGGIPGRLLCTRVGIDRSRLSHIERGYVKAPKEELARIRQALDDLIQSKKRIIATAAEVGWPVDGL